MLIRPPSRPPIAILKPSPRFPRRLDWGTRTLSNMIVLVGEDFHPIFCSGFPKEIPEADLGTITQDFSFLSVRSMTR